ncbi:MAG: 30S ribosomal protein S6 [Parcubacteria group bacterium]|jgi:ribosomal protein S6
MLYELCYLVGESKEQEFARIKEEVSAIVSKEGGKWLEPQIEEKRKMAYKVGKEARGVYVAQQFEIIKEEEKENEEMANTLDDINKKLNLYNDILRFIIVKAEDLPELKIREGKPVFAKDLGKERGNYDKPVYIKKTETAPKEKVSDFAKTMTGKEEIAGDEKKIKEVEKPDAAKAIAGEEEKNESKKSIDEKIDEILNI